MRWDPLDPIEVHRVSFLPEVKDQIFAVDCVVQQRFGVSGREWRHDVSISIRHTPYILDGQVLKLPDVQIHLHAMSHPLIRRR